RFGRTVQVAVQVEAARKQAEDLAKLKVRNAKGQMVPLGALAVVRELTAPAVVHRLDGRPAVQLTANPAPGGSLAEARALCEAAAEEVRKELRLPADYRLTWLREPPASK